MCIRDSSKFVGVRHVLQDEADDNYMLDLHFQRGISQLRRFDLKYDLLIFPRQLPAAIRLASAFPEQPFVLDHIAKPPIKEGVLDPWRGHLQKLATLPNVFCKVSGLITEADWGRWHPSQFRPYLDLSLIHISPLLASACSPLLRMGHRAKANARESNRSSMAFPGKGWTWHRYIRTCSEENSRWRPRQRSFIRQRPGRLATRWL